jgi:cytochrome c-type biogenesis protein CcmH/NrfG
LFLFVALCGGRLVAGHAAQSGGIEGTVKDANGRPLSNAKVTLNRGDGITPPSTATTAPNGRYEIRSHLPGVYVVCAEAAGYQESHREGIMVTADAMTVVDFTLTPAKTAPAKQRSASAETTVSGCQRGFLDNSGMKAAGYSGSTDPSGYSAAADAQTRGSLMEGATDLRKRANTPETAPAADPRSHEDRSVALQEYERAFQIEPSEENRYNWGLELLLQGEVASALRLFKEGVAGNSQSARLWIGLGIALYSSGHADDAVRAFLSATDLNPTDPHPYLFLGKAYGISNNLTAEVNTRLNRWIELEPGNARAYYYDALSLWKGQGRADLNEDMKRIEALFEKSALLDPTFPLPHLQLGNLFSQENRLPEAIAEYRESVRLKPDLADAHYHLGQVYLRTGQKELGQQQMTLYEQLHGKQPANPDLVEEREFVESLKGRGNTKPVAP